MTSSILTKLAETYPEVLTNPESILGPNHPKVLEFWIYIEGLSAGDKWYINKLYNALGLRAQDSAWDAALKAADKVVGEDFRWAAWLATYDASEKWHIFGDATYEIIGGVEDPIFYNLIMNHKNSSSV
jgi:hypothetical protein